MSDIENSVLGQVFRGVEEDVPLHMHCQKTVLSAYGPDGQGKTWEEINKLTNELRYLNEINSNWINYFKHNQDDSNITHDLAAILRLINNLSGKVSSQSGGSSSFNEFTLFFTADGKQITETRIEPDKDNYEIDLKNLNRELNLTINRQSAFKFNTILSNSNEKLDVDLNREVTLSINGKELKFNTLKPGGSEVTKIDLPIPTVSVEQKLPSGTEVADIVIGDEKHTIFCPPTNISAMFIGPNSTQTRIGKRIAWNTNGVSDMPTEKSEGTSGYCKAFNVMSSTKDNSWKDYKYAISSTSDSKYDRKDNFWYVVQNPTDDMLYEVTEDGFVRVHVDSGSQHEHGQAYVYAFVGDDNKTRMTLWECDLGKSCASQNTLIPVKAGLKLEIFCLASAGQYTPCSFWAYFIKADKT